MELFSLLWVAVCMLDFTLTTIFVHSDVGIAIAFYFLIFFLLSLSLFAHSLLSQAHLSLNCYKVHPRVRDLSVVQPRNMYMRPVLFSCLHFLTTS